MPAGIKYAQNGGVENPAFSAILATVVARLQAAIPASRGGMQVRVVAMPDDKLKEYVAEPGFLLRVQPPAPFGPSGAGRNCYMVTRRVDLFVLTENLSDPGGRDEVAVYAHCDVEEEAVNALLLNPPVGIDYNLRTGITIRWVPGGEALARLIDVDPGQIASSMSFEIEYAARVLTYRD